MTTENIGNYSAQHRLECEARHVLKYKREQRHAYYEKASLLRGATAISALKAEVGRQYKLSQEQSAEMEM